MASPSLYEVLKIKKEESIYKSVYIHAEDYTDEGYPVVEVEAYDGFFQDENDALNRLHLIGQLP